MNTRLMKVVGYTNKGVEVIGDFMYGTIYKKKTIYFIADKIGIIHECINCKNQ